MCSKEQLKKFLEEISSDAEFVQLKYVSPESYNIRIKCKIERDSGSPFYNEYTKEWIKKFAKFTSTAWIVKRSFPSLKRLLYRKTYLCHHSSRNKTKLLIRNKSRNRDCRAEIDFKVKIINTNTIKNDKYLKDGLNLNIYVDFTHSHAIRAVESYKELKCSSETDAAFAEYFRRGYNPNTAKCYHELYLMFSRGGMADEYIANTDINPRIRHLFYLQKKNKSQQVLGICDIMLEKEKDLEERGGAFTYRPDLNDVKVVITPLMKNIILSHRLDQIIVDRIPIKDGFVTFFFVATAIGALPIAAALDEYPTTVMIFKHAFSVTKELIEKTAQISFEPKVFISNDISAQIIALQTTFPNSFISIQRTSKCVDIWRTICDDTVKIDSRKRHAVMVSFYKLLNANNVEQAKKCYDELHNNQLVTDTLRQELDNVWKHHLKYISQSNTLILDVSLYTLREFIYCKCLNFNTIIMVDMISNVLDLYWRHILWASLNQNSVMEAYTKYLPKNEGVINNILDLKVSDTIYRIKNGDLLEKHSTKIGVIRFRSDTMCCNCLNGKRGRFCEHLTAMVHTFKSRIDLSQVELECYTKLVGEIPQETLTIKTEIQSEIVGEELALSDDNELNEGQMTNENSDECYFVVKEEIETEENELKDYVDPLDEDQTKYNHYDENMVEADEGERSTKTVSDNNLVKFNLPDVKNLYENVLTGLNTEFQRLSKFFKENPNTANLDTMIRLNKELNKIKAVETVNMSDMFLEVNCKSNIDK